MFHKKIISRLLILALIAALLLSARLRPVQQSFKIERVNVTSGNVAAASNGLFAYPHGFETLARPRPDDVTNGPVPTPLILLAVGSFLLLRRRRKPVAAAISDPKDHIMQSEKHGKLQMQRKQSDDDLFCGRSPFGMPTKWQIRLQLILGLALAILWACSAQAAVVVNFDESGNGNVQSTAGTTPLISLGNIPDPFDPTNGLTPLVYDLSGSINAPAQDGDIGLVEIPGQLPLSDLVRFFTNNGKAFIVVYSELPEPGETPVPLADVGLPQNGVFQPNFITLVESGPEAGPNGLFNYTPNAGDPGFVPTPTGPATYNFFSDGTVPEPASMGLLAFGTACVLLVRRRRR